MSNLDSRKSASSSSSSGRKSTQNSSESSDKYAQALRDIQSRCPENKACFECRQRGPTYVDVTIGSFVCSKCSGILRGITPPHRVKSISMATFTHDEVEGIRTRGNVYNAKVWLGLYDFKARGAMDIKDDDSIREFIVQKYEKKRFYVDPSTIRHTVEPETQSSSTSGNISQTSPPKFIGSTLQFHSKTGHSSSGTPSAVVAAARPVAATPPPIQAVKLPPSLEKPAVAATLPGPSVPLSKVLSSVAPAQQIADPFGVSSSSGLNSTLSHTSNQNDFFSKNDSFANFDAANIYTSPASNPLTAQSPPSQLDFGFPPMPIPVTATAAKPAPQPSAAKPPMAVQPQAEDKYAALKDLDDVFKSSVEISKSKSPTFGMSNGINIDPPKSANTFMAPSGNGFTGNARTAYNPFATPPAGTTPSGSTLNTSPWPLSASPSGPGFGAGNFGNGGFGTSSSGFGQKDFFPSPWDTASQSSPSTGPAPNMAVDFFATKAFPDPWADSPGAGGNSQPAFGINRRNPFL